MAVFGVVNRNDEITNYQMGRYISSNEAVWRILSFPIHDRHPAVIHLSVHLENEQSVYFTENTAQQMAERPTATTLAAFFNLCETDSFARTLLYSNVPKYYTWNASSRSWVRRQRGIPVDGYPGVHLGDAIGRLYTVHPSKVECFYLRLLLVDIPGPRSFESLKRVNGHLCCTYQVRQAYDTIIDNVANERGGIFFLDAPGGTGKTFLLSLILATIRSQNNIALALASSGIAATLLDGGRTAHSALKLPLNMQVNEEPTCNISKNSGMGKVLQTCKIIVWDECTMAHKKSLEALNRTLKDFRNNTNIFGGALILLAGDFRQTLPVIPKSTAADELRACLKSSNLWRYVQKLTLTTNVRVQLQNDPTAAEFSEHLLQIGNGRKPIDKNTGMITLPTNFCTVTESRAQLVQNVFPNIAQNYRNQDWLSERAILAAKNVDVNEINASILTQIPGEVVTYKSIDSITNPDDVVNYPIEFLNSLNLPGLPPHRLQLKVGAVIIMLRNINQPKLCNGTRLAVKRTMNNVIEATILKGKFKGEDVLIPRIPMISTDLPFDFKRLQFPIRLAFAITINKSQGQTLQLCGIDLTYPCFGHGQLYVGCSRVGKPSLLYIYTPHENKTKNFVYQKALE